MKIFNKCMILVLVAVVLAPGAGVWAQTPDNAASKTRQRFATKNPEPAQKVQQDGNAIKPSGAQSVSTKKGKTSAGEADEPKPNSDTEQSASAGSVVATTSDVPETTQVNRHEQSSEEADIV